MARKIRLHHLALSTLTVFYIVRILPQKNYDAFGWDASIYLVLAKSLAHGHGLRMINEPSAGFSPYYPIGFPAILSLIYRFVSIEGFGFVALCSVSIVACLISLFFSYHLVRRYHSEVLSACLVFLLGLNPTLVQFAGRTMSECVFGLWAVIAVLLAKRATDDDMLNHKTGNWFIVASGICVGCATLTRTAGMAIAAGLAIGFFVSKGWKMMVRFLAAFLCIEVPFFIYKTVQLQREGSGEGYVGWALERYKWTTPIDNLYAYFSYFSGSLFPPIVSSPGLALLGKFGMSNLIYWLGCFVFLLIICGCFFLLRKKDVVSYVLICYLLMITFYPWYPERFLLPLNPLLLISAVECCKRAKNLTFFDKPILQHAIVSALLIACLAGSVIVNYQRVKNLYKHGHISGEQASRQWLEARSAFEWIKANTSEDAVIVTYLAAGTYLFTGRKAVVAGTTGEEVKKTLFKHNKSAPLYLFLYSTITFENDNKKSSFDPAQEFLSANPESAQLMWASPQMDKLIYKISN